MQWGGEHHRGEHPSGRDRRGRGQRGATLVELIICILLISTVVIGLISGLFTSIAASSSNESRQRIEAALISFGTTVKQMSYQKCPTPLVNGTSYTTAYTLLPAATTWQPPTGMTVKVIDVDFWRSTPDPVNNLPVGWSNTCPTPTGDRGSQRLTLEVSYRGKVGTAQVVKRNPARTS